MSKITNKKKELLPVKYKYLLPKSCYKKVIKKYTDTSTTKIRIYSSFIQFIDHSLTIQNKELLQKLLVLKKAKTLTQKDIGAFVEIVRMYNPRTLVTLDSNRTRNLRGRIRKLAGENQKLRLTLKGWEELTDLIHQEIENLGLIIERYVIKTGRVTLSNKDIPLIFNSAIDFLL